jgi:hypothetical protein
MKALKFFFSSICLGCLVFLVIVSLASKYDKIPAAPVVQSVEAATRPPQSPNPPTDENQVPADLIYHPSEADTDRVPMVALASSVAPGAIVCSNLHAVRMVSHLYAEAWEEQTQGKLTQGASRQIEGEPMQSPNPRAYGCELLAPGTHILANNMQWIPNVVASLPDGTQIRGVTLVAMLGSVNPSSMPDQLVSN